MRRLVLCLVFACCLSVVLLLCSASAGAKTPTLKSLAKTVAALQKKVTKQAQTITSLSARLAADEQKLTDAASVLALAPYVSLTTATMSGVVGPNIVFQNCNVHVRSTTNETDSSHLGNLIVGWNDLPGGALPSPFRTGANNLVLGNGNNFTSSGCFVAGSQNTVSGLWCAVSGGQTNVASQTCASLSGGGFNTAEGALSSGSGGESNKAHGNGASVSGGGFNVAATEASSVSGGGGYGSGSGLVTGAPFAWMAGNTTIPGNGIPAYHAP